MKFKNEVQISASFRCPTNSDIRTDKGNAEQFERNVRQGTATKVRWPSGLRRQLKALVRKGVGSNPTLIILFVFSHLSNKFLSI